MMEAKCEVIVILVIDKSILSTGVLVLFLHKLLSFVQLFVQKTKEQKFFDNLHEKEKKGKQA